MFAWNKIAGVAVILFTVYFMVTGRIPLTDVHDRTDWLERSKKPVQFWLLILACLALAAVFFFVFDFLP